MNCLLCRTNNLSYLYTPQGTRREVTIQLCSNCGLLQSFPPDTHGDGISRISANADFGNIRTGKRGREKQALALFQKFATDSPGSVLDVGASRGWFCKAVLEVYPESRVVGIEPDSKLVWQQLSSSKRKFPAYGLIGGRIEDTQLPDGEYDWISLIHTLEHLPDPLTQLTRLTKALKPVTGLIYIEVPNTGSILSLPDTVEEFFIDKHITHFTELTLIMMIQTAGLRPLEVGWDTDHLWAIGSRAVPIRPRPTNESAKMLGLVPNYYETLIKNRTILARTCPKWLPTGKAIVWGCGRILDALIQAGFDLNQFEAIIDVYPPLGEYQGLPVLKPGMVTEIKPEQVLVCSRSGFEEIRNEVTRLVPGVEVIKWDQFLGVG